MNGRTSPPLEAHFNLSLVHRCIQVFQHVQIFRCCSLPAETRKGTSKETKEEEGDERGDNGGNVV